jgi:hypothetical protein
MQHDMNLIFDNLYIKNKIIRIKEHQFFLSHKDLKKFNYGNYKIG